MKRVNWKRISPTLLMGLERHISEPTEHRQDHIWKLIFEE